MTEVNSGRRVRVRKSEVDELFDKFWAIYPKKKHKQTAWAKFNTRLQAGVDPTVILVGAQLVAQELAAGHVQLQYVPYPATWLNANGWDDETTRAEVAASVEPAPMTAFQRSIEDQREFMRRQDASIVR